MKKQVENATDDWVKGRAIYGYNSAIADLKALRDGGKDWNNVAQYFPRWTQDDFRDLLNELGEG